MLWIALGALGCALSAGAGAFGAHGLAARLDRDALALWETAARYLMYGSFGTILVGLVGEVTPRAAPAASGWCLAAGTVIFSGTVGALALGGPRWLGAVTPFGGVLIILGFVLLAAHPLRG